MQIEPQNGLGNNVLEMVVCGPESGYTANSVHPAIVTLLTSVSIEPTPMRFQTLIIGLLTTATVAGTAFVDEPQRTLPGPAPTKLTLQESEYLVSIIDACSEAIQNNPKDALAHARRGLA